MKKVVKKKPSPGVIKQVRQRLSRRSMEIWGFLFLFLACFVLASNHFPNSTGVLGHWFVNYFCRNAFGDAVLISLALRCVQFSRGVNIIFMLATHVVRLTSGFERILDSAQPFILAVLLFSGVLFHVRHPCADGGVIAAYL